MVSADKLLLSTYKRSDQWPKLRRHYLRNFDTCAVCGARKKLIAHHVAPYHIHPELELDMGNLITLCNAHHILFGHLNDFSSHNENVRQDSAWWRDRIRKRPNKVRYPRRGK